MKLNETFQSDFDKVINNAWENPAEKKLVKILFQNKDKILANEESGKAFISQLAEKNKGLLQSNCSDAFLSALYLVTGEANDAAMIENKIIKKAGQVITKLNEGTTLEDLMRDEIIDYISISIGSELDSLFSLVMNYDAENKDVNEMRQEMKAYICDGGVDDSELKDIYKIICKNDELFGNYRKYLHENRATAQQNKNKMYRYYKVQYLNEAKYVAVPPFAINTLLEHESVMEFALESKQLKTDKGVDYVIEVSPQEFTEVESDLEEDFGAEPKDEKPQDASSDASKNKFDTVKKGEGKGGAQQEDGKKLHEALLDIFADKKTQKKKVNESGGMFGDDWGQRPGDTAYDLKNKFGKEYSKRIKELDTIKQEYENIPADAIYRALKNLKVYDRPVQEFIDNYIANPNSKNLTTETLINLGIKISNSSGTEPRMVLNAIQDLYSSLRRYLNVEDEGLNEAWGDENSNDYENEEGNTYQTGSLHEEQEDVYLGDKLHRDSASDWDQEERESEFDHEPTFEDELHNFEGEEDLNEMSDNDSVLMRMRASKSSPLDKKTVSSHEDEIEHFYSPVDETKLDDFENEKDYVQFTYLTQDEFNKIQNTPLAKKFVWDKKSGFYKKNELSEGIDPDQNEWPTGGFGDDEFDNPTTKMKESTSSDHATGREKVFDAHDPMAHSKYTIDSSKMGNFEDELNEGDETDEEEYGVSNGQPSLGDDLSANYRDYDNKEFTQDEFESFVDEMHRRHPYLKAEDVREYLLRRFFVKEENDIMEDESVKHENENIKSFITTVIKKYGQAVFIITSDEDEIQENSPYQLCKADKQWFTDNYWEPFEYYESREDAFEAGRRFKGAFIGEYVNDTTLLKEGRYGKTNCPKCLTKDSYPIAGDYMECPNCHNHWKKLVENTTADISVIADQPAFANNRKKIETQNPFGVATEPEYLDDAEVLQEKFVSYVLRNCKGSRAFIRSGKFQIQEFMTSKTFGYLNSLEEDFKKSLKEAEDTGMQIDDVSVDWSQDLVEIAYFYPSDTEDRVMKLTRDEFFDYLETNDPTWEDFETKRLGHDLKAYWEHYSYKEQMRLAYAFLINAKGVSKTL